MYEYYRNNIEPLNEQLAEMLNNKEVIALDDNFEEAMERWELEKLESKYGNNVSLQR